MTELLRFLISYFSYLYEDYGAKFVDSDISGENALLVLAINDLRLRFVRDRGQLFLDFQYYKNDEKSEWFSFDVVRQLILGEVSDSSILDEKKARFVKKHFQEIIKAFSESEYFETRKSLNKFEHARASRIFS